MDPQPTSSNTDTATAELQPQLPISKQYGTAEMMSKAEMNKLQFDSTLMKETVDLTYEEPRSIRFRSTPVDIDENSTHANMSKVLMKAFESGSLGQHGKTVHTNQQRL